ncbi:MAG TPA: hypothetical protein VK144_00370 [Bacillota bacterium]|nr:hypothetical protein [Bacillota bacterium]
MKKLRILYIDIFGLLIIVGCSNGPKESVKEMENQEEGTFKHSIYHLLIFIFGHLQ